MTATNGAEASTSATSDGFTVDLTDPSMLQLVDGDDLKHDKQYSVSVTRRQIVTYYVWYMY